MPKKSGGGSAKILHAPSPWPGCLPAGRMGTRSWALWQGAHRLKLKERILESTETSPSSLGGFSWHRSEGGRREGGGKRGRREEGEGGRRDPPCLPANRITRAPRQPFLLPSLAYDFVLGPGCAPGAWSVSELPMKAEHRAS